MRVLPLGIAYSGASLFQTPLWLYTARCGKTGAPAAFLYLPTTPLQRTVLTLVIDSRVNHAVFPHAEHVDRITDMVVNVACKKQKKKNGVPLCRTAVVVSH